MLGLEYSLRYLDVVVIQSGTFGVENRKRIGRIVRVAESTADEFTRVHCQNRLGAGMYLVG